MLQWNKIGCVFYRTKLKNHEYETLDHLECDLNLMFENAKRYNVPNSAIYKRVLKMQQVMQVKLYISFVTRFVLCQKQKLYLHLQWHAAVDTWILSSKWNSSIFIF